ncbi:Pyridoxal phosphate dependent transferase major region subdomain 1 [Echinococcus multilocularis]|uniref:Kynureninase n=1 Tax=Echinococcus multilocularis TaxID=6211 RepID=A0A068YC63_ECHMU|nr:Pyridoxal phosphate dependent transferase major region subdomain 1 [Echinococcus multilocularis]
MDSLSIRDLEELALELDDNDPLKGFRDKFKLPTMFELVNQVNGASSHGGTSDSAEVIYLCTNSLGLPPKSTGQNLEKVLESWRTMGVLSHTQGCSPTETSDLRPKEILAEYIVGAKVNEVAVMESLTANIHTLLASFYRPEGKKCCILIEKNAFPSDYYALESQVHLRGVDKSALIELDLRPNNKYLATKEIIDEIKELGEKLAFVWLPGVSYLTGQMLDIPSITEAVHNFCNCPVGWELAHSVGNVPLALHDWNVDCAAWCGYKYLCGSPGGCAGIFVHEKHFLKPGEFAPTEEHKYAPTLTGWWGHRYSTRFQMTNKMEVEGGADSYRRSCPSMLLNSALTSSLEIFAEAGGMTPLREKSILLTSYLEALLFNTPIAQSSGLELITPSDVQSRGSQLSIKVNVDVEKLYNRLIKRGVICDTRKPCYIRLAPFALYTSFNDVLKAGKIITEEIGALLED